MKILSISLLLFLPGLVLPLSAQPVFLQNSLSVETAGSETRTGPEPAYERTGRPGVQEAAEDSRAAGVPDLDRILSFRERFVYSVRYSFLNLGEIEVELMPDTTWKGMPVMHLRTVMRSGPRIPFVSSRHVHYNTYFVRDGEKLCGYRFWRDDLHDDEPERTVIEFDRDAGLVYFFDRGEPQDTLALEEPASGGDLIFYFSRLHAGEEEPYAIPVYIENDRGSVTAVSSPETEMRNYDAFSGAVETYHSEGMADIDGPFGFRGRFRSWFSTDELRLPVEAHVRVFFGNVRIRLISYEQLEERQPGAVSAPGACGGS